MDYEILPLENKTLKGLTVTKYRVTRNVTVTECPWLSRKAGGPGNVYKGTEVVKFLLPTYGAVDQFAATLNPQGDYPFFELPYDAVEPVDE